MEETLGKRIVSHRKRLGLTQDKLAEALGVTAQAVSKWENDQSCPDITTLPKLARLFGITTDELLGLETKKVLEAEVIAEPEPEGLHVQDGKWEFQWDGGRKSGLGLALWILTSGGLLFASNYFHWNISFFHILWTSGLTLYGLFGLYPRLSLDRLCCALLGGYFFYDGIHPLDFAWDYLLPLFLIVFGLSLLFKALARPRHGRFYLTRNGKSISGTTSNHCECSDSGFACEASFGSCTYPIQLSRLEEGRADVSFGELTVDLRDCQEAAEGCKLELDCSFGQMTLLIPERFRVEPEYDTAFGSVEIEGVPDSDAALIRAECNASFGHITLKYV